MKAILLSCLSLCVIGLASCGGVNSATAIFNPNARTPALIAYQVNANAGSISQPVTAKLRDAFGNTYDDQDLTVDDQCSFVPLSVVDPPSLNSLEFQCSISLVGQATTSVNISISADPYQD